MTLAAAKPFAVAAWTLDEASGTRSDSVGSSHLADNNTVLSAAGMFGNAADFESSNGEYLSIADNAALSTGDVDFTIRCWVKLESLSGFPVVAHKGPDTSQREWILYFSAGSNVLIFQVGTSGDVRVTAPSTGAWALVHAWHDSAADQIGIALNAGTPDAAAHAAPPDGTGAFELGGSSDQSLYFDGLIDDFVFLKGRVLSSAERTEDYNSGAGVPFANWDAGGAAGHPAARRLGGVAPAAFRCGSEGVGAW